MCGSNAIVYIYIYLQALSYLTSTILVHAMINCFITGNWVKHSKERLSSVNTDNNSKRDVFRNIPVFIIQLASLFICL